MGKRGPKPREKGCRTHGTRVKGCRLCHTIYMRKWRIEWRKVIGMDERNWRVQRALIKAARMEREIDIALAYKEDLRVGVGGG